MENKKITTIDEYILQYDISTQEILFKLKNLIKEIVPDIEERMSWQMPTFYLNGNLVHFAVHKNHLGFYPGPSGVEVFKEKLKEYKTSKGAIQFPFQKPIPYELIREIVEYRVKENKKMLGSEKDA